jgi:hypothetical protein
MTQHADLTVQKDTTMPFRLLMISAILLSPALTQQSSAQDPTTLKNVALSASHEFSVQVVDDHGQGIPGVTVTTTCQKIRKTVITNDAGRAVIPGLTSGTCFLQIADQGFACRLWISGTAPPKSLTSLALVNGDTSIVRGNWFSRKECPGNYCEPCEQTHGLSSKAKHGLAIVALAGTAAYFALSRDNASE